MKACKRSRRGEGTDVICFYHYACFHWLPVVVLMDFQVLFLVLKGLSVLQQTTVDRCCCCVKQGGLRSSGSALLAVPERNRNIWRRWVEVTHPANQTGPHLAEELEVKVADARVELPTFEEVVQQVSWWRREGGNQSIPFNRSKANQSLTSEQDSPEFPPSARSVGGALPERTYR